jgi:hypothetical protein
MALSKVIRLSMLVVVAMLLPACYHMRVMPEPIQPRIISVGLTPDEVLPRLRKVLDEELHVHVLKEEQEGNVLLTFPLQFHTDTGFGQPPGGRRYYVQLRIDLDRQGGQTMITVAADRFELRTSYAYSDEGQLHTLTKIYPYEEYPGMFDLSVMIREMRKVTGIIERAMKD